MSKLVDRETWLRKTSDRFKNEFMDKMADAFLDSLISEAYFTSYNLLYDLYHSNNPTYSILGSLIIRPKQYNADMARSLAFIDEKLISIPMFFEGKHKILYSLKIIKKDQTLQEFLNGYIACWHENWYYDLINEKLCVTQKTMQAIEKKTIIIKNDAIVDEYDLENMIYKDGMIFDEKLNQHSRYVNYIERK